ncbi:MAG: SulP family inorganic anion transporter [Thermodesulfobacteriota bacterium]
MRNNFSMLTSDFFGGLSGAVAVLPQTIGLSVLLFTSFGLDASAGAMAGLIGAVVLLFSSGLAGATIGMISAPNGPVTILLSGLVIKLAPEYSPHEILVILSTVLFFTGIFQIVFGMLKGGEIIKLIPYPVMASMITAIGILMIKSQADQIIPSQSIDSWYRYIPFIVASVTIATIFIFKKLSPRLPSILMGLLSGIIAYSILTFSITNPDPKWVIGNLPAIDYGDILHRFDSIHVSTLPWQLILASALALAVLVMTDCLLTALVADTQTALRHNAKKELVAQGVAQMIIGVVGGVGGGGTKGSTLANTMAGGRRWSPVFAALAILLMTLFGRGIGTFLPLSALSGVIIYIGLNMININIILWLKGRYTRIDAVNALMVIAATLVFDVTKAVALGMIFAIITFIRNGIKRSLIRRETNITEYPSPRKRSEKHRKILAEYGDKALLIELRGDLYFATTDQLYRRIMERIEDRLVIIMHFRRVLSIDMSGMVILMQLVEIANKNGTEIVFTHLHKRLGFGRKMKRAFSLIESKKTNITKIFHSTARSLEYAEDIILKNEYKNKEYRVSSPVDFENNDLCKGIDKDGIDLLKKISMKKDYETKEVILAEGKKNSSLYLVTKGFVEQRLYNGPTSYKVLAKFSPGTYFGELAFFNLGPVSTRFVALGDTTLHKIIKSDIEQESGKMENNFFADFLFAIGRNLSKESNRLISEIQRLEAL